MKKLDGIKLSKASKTEFKNMFRVVVRADENDADYVYETTDISEDEIGMWLPAIKLISDGKINGWGEIRKDPYYLTPAFDDETDDLLSDLIPSGEYGVHSVSLSEFLYFDENGTVFKASVK